MTDRWRPGGKKMFTARNPTKANGNTKTHDLAANPEFAGKLKRAIRELESQLDALDDPKTSLDTADYSIKEKRKQ